MDGLIVDTENMIHKKLKEILEKYNDTDIEIQYFKQNPVGAFYEKLGFEKSGETNFHYQMTKSKSVT